MTLNIGPIINNVTLEGARGVREIVTVCDKGWQRLRKNVIPRILVKKIKKLEIPN